MAAEGGRALVDGGLCFVVEHGAGEAVASATHVGEQLNPGSIRGNEIDVQIAVVGMCNVDLDVDVGD